MERVKEITVFLANHPGALARVVEALGAKRINILGFALTNALDHGSLRLVVSKPTAALHLFGERDLLAIENDVLMIKLENVPGALARLAAALGKGGVNIDYAYGSAGPKAKGPTTLFLRVSDETRAKRILGKMKGVS